MKVRKKSFCWTLFTLLFLTTPLNAGEPVLRNLDVRGLQIGGTTTVQLQISANAGTARATSIVVADRLFLITQNGP